MKRLFYLMSFILCIGFLCACTQTEETGILNSWDCTVTRSEMTADDLPTYSDEIIVSSTGCLTFENESDFDIAIFFYVDGISERAEELAANSKVVLYGMNKDVEYTIGVYSSVEAGTEIKLLAHDGIMSLVESEPGAKKPISAEKAIKMAQKYIKTDKEYVSNYDNPSIVVKVGVENLIVMDTKTREYVSSDEFIGRELYVISFETIDANWGAIDVYVDKYKGVVLGTGIVM